ncbi:MAG: hypothetical protein H0X03_09745 [Nitrosopumilus sp.]|nr:hypothetical protein [Nitrosopumilus sp.]
MANVMQIANKIAEEFTTLSNIYRVLILMYLNNNNNSNWSKIKEFIEQSSGIVNPNTLHFHLKSLINMRYIKRSGSRDSITYKLDKENIPKFIIETIESKNNELSK